jgi:DNA polymerase III delta subunit
VPSLNLQALKQQIADRALARVYLFVGEDVKLVDRMVDGIEAVVDPADRPFAVERLYAGEASGTPQAIADASRILPMLGDRRIVIVLRAERLLKPKRASKTAAPADDAAEDDGEAEQAVDGEGLEDYLASPSASTTLVFVATEIDRTRRLTKRVLETASVVEFAGLSGVGPRRDVRPSAAEWLREELTRVGRTIETDAARMLAERSGNDITKLRSDVERLLLFVGDRKKLTTDDVMEVVATQSAADDWAVVNAIGDGNAARALVETAHRFERGVSPHALVGQLRWWVSTRLVAADPSRVRPALDALLRTDLALKRSAGDERALIERLVVELTGRPLPPQRRF